MGSGNGKRFGVRRIRTSNLRVLVVGLVNGSGIEQPPLNGTPDSAEIVGQKSI